jgi:hypothetical protein
MLPQLKAKPNLIIIPSDYSSPQEMRVIMNNITMNIFLININIANGAIAKTEYQDE